MLIDYSSTACTALQLCVKIFIILLVHDCIGYYKNYPVKVTYYATVINDVLHCASMHLSLESLNTVSTAAATGPGAKQVD